MGRVMMLLMLLLLLMRMMMMMMRMRMMWMMMMTMMMMLMLVMPDTMLAPAAEMFAPVPMHARSPSGFESARRRPNSRQTARAMNARR